MFKDERDAAPSRTPVEIAVCMPIRLSKSARTKTLFFFSGQTSSTERFMSICAMDEVAQREEKGGGFALFVEASPLVTK